MRGSCITLVFQAALNDFRETRRLTLKSASNLIGNVDGYLHRTHTTLLQKCDQQRGRTRLLHSTTARWIRGVAFGYDQSMVFEPQKYIASHVRAIPRSGIRDFFDIVD